MMMAAQEDEERDWLDALDRAIQEVEALQIIYQAEEYDGSSSSSNNNNNNIDNDLLLVKSTNELEKARELVSIPNTTSARQMIPTLELEMNVVCTNNNSDDCEGDQQQSTIAAHAALSARLYFGLPPGYPSYEPVKVTVLTTENIPGGRSTQEDLNRHLQEKSREGIGSESIMELIQECQEQLAVVQQLATKERQQVNEEEAQAKDISQNKLGRRWIWVHHITDRQRKDDIVQEARDRNLAGYLKAGYPGIVVIEGSVQSCNEFVMWIKGNKSRPGGFGRQWGHHVRGEINDIVEGCKLPPSTFVALQEDMSVLASLCREKELEDEFLKFVMQHG